MKKLYSLLFCLLIAACSMVTKQQPQPPALLQEQAITELQQGNLDSATDKLNTVLTKEPQSWKALNAMGIIYSLKNNLPQAESSFAAADAANPNNTPVLNNWGLALAIDNRYDEAIAKLMQAVEVSPPENRTQPEMNLALVYALSGNDKSAQLILHRYMEPAKIKENMKFYSSLRKDREKSRQALQNAYGLPQPEAPTGSEPQSIFPPSFHN